MEGLPLLDALMANAWRPRVEEVLGGWRYRWTDGLSRRANSVLTVETDESIDGLVDHAEVFYGERAAPTLIQVSTASAPRGLAARLRTRGYRPSVRTLVQHAGSVGVVGRSRPALEIRIEVTGTLTEEWFFTYWSVEAARGRSGPDTALYRDVILVPGPAAVFATARVGSEAVGVGQLVIERGWGGVQCMATVPSHRGRGVAGAVLNGLAEEAVRRGVDRMYLAVMAGNNAARAVYRKAGFRTAHEYSYWSGHQGTV